LTTQEQKVNGRINEECILLKVFQWKQYSN
jgi:hypothetical protein